MRCTHQWIQHEIPVNFDSVKCSPLFDIRESQAVGQNGPATPDQPPLHNVNHTARNFTQLAGGQNPSSSNLPSRTRTSSRPDMAETFGAGGNVIYGDAQGAAMDLSPDVSTGEAHVSKGTPDHPTPSTSSNKGSSHTSFTPPHFDDNSHSGYPSSQLQCLQTLPPMHTFKTPIHMLSSLLKCRQGTKRVQAVYLVPSRSLRAGTTPQMDKQTLVPA